MKTVKIGSVSIGPRLPLAYICGPCAIESEELVIQVAKYLVALREKLDIPIIFKSSFIKANRQSIDAFTGPGRDEGLAILAKIKQDFKLPIITDIHTEEDALAAAKVVDCLQIPAFLCRQTSLITAAATTGKPINIKKGQFLAPEDMVSVAAKARAAGNDDILFTERGTTFGYHDLVVDMRGLAIMATAGYPLVYDATHSVQQPGAGSGCSGGQRELILPLARGAAAVGCQAFFVETHPRPENALCDAGTMLPLDELENFITVTRSIHECVRTAE